MRKQAFDASFRKRAVALSHTGKPVKEVAAVLGISPDLLSKWRSRSLPVSKSAIRLRTVQQETKQLRKALRQAQLERDILKKARTSLSGRNENYSASSSSTARCFL